MGRHEEISVCKPFKGVLWEEEIKSREKQTMVRKKERRKRKKIVLSVNYIIHDKHLLGI